MKIKFLQDYKNGDQDVKAGAVTEVSDVVGKGLMALNIGEEIKEEKAIMTVDEKALSVLVHNKFVEFQNAQPKVSAPAVKKSFGEYLKDIAERKTVNITTNTQGQYAVTYQTLTDKIDIVGTGGVAGLLNKMSFSGTDNEVHVNILTSVGTAPAIVAEDSASTPSQPVLAQVPIVLKKLMYTYVISAEAMKDTDMLQSLINTAVQAEFDKYIEYKVLTGTYATDGFEGIIGATDTYSVAAESGQDAETINKENIMKMYNALKNKNGAVWVMSRTALSAVQTLTTGGTPGYPLFQANFTKSPEGTLCGLPIVISDYAKALGTVGDIILANFRTGYQMVQKYGLTVAATDDLYFLYDQRCYKFTYRMGGRIVSKKLTASGDSSSIADFVTLASRT